MIGNRQQVVWLGQGLTPEVEREFLQRRLHLQVGPPESWSVIDVRAAVFSTTSSVFEEIVATADVQVRRLLDYGTRMDFIADSDAMAGRLQAALGDLLALTNVQVRTNPQIFEVAEAERDTAPAHALVSICRSWWRATANLFERLTFRCSSAPFPIASASCWSS